MKDLVRELFPEMSKRVHEILPIMLETAEELHDNPESSFEEVYACDYLTGLLRRNGFVVQTGIAGMETAFEARLSWGEGGPTVAIVAEYDALPGIGHACGHNLYAATSVGAVLALKDYLCCHAVGSGGEVRLIGTPAEEKGGGKCIMAEKGVFDELDAVLGIHPAEVSGVGGGSLALSQYYVCFSGRAVHAADSPERGINALDAVIATFNNVNALRQHVRDDARIHGVILHGGVSANMVPDYAEAEFLVRSADETYQSELVERFKCCAEGAAMASGAKLELKQIRLPYQATKINSALQGLLSECYEYVGEPIESPPSKISGSSGVGNMSQVVPTVQGEFFLGSEDVSLHTREFARLAGGDNEAYLARAAAVLSTAVLCCFADQEILLRAWQDFHNTVEVVRRGIT